MEEKPEGRLVAEQLRCETWGRSPGEQLTLSGWVCCSAPGAVAASVTAEAGANLGLSFSETKRSVDACGVSSVYSGTGRVGI